MKFISKSAVILLLSISGPTPFMAFALDPGAHLCRLGVAEFLKKISAINGQIESTEIQIQETRSLVADHELKIHRYTRGVISIRQAAVTFQNLAELLMLHKDLIVTMRNRLSMTDAPSLKTWLSALDREISKSGSSNRQTLKELRQALGGLIVSLDDNEHVLIETALNELNPNIALYGVEELETVIADYEIFLAEENLNLQNSNLKLTRLNSELSILNSQLIETEDSLNKYRSRPICQQ